METERDLFEARVELKKFHKADPKKVLYILKKIRDCSHINKQWIRSTRITKTLSRIALHKYSERDETRILIIKVSNYLLNKYKAFFPKLGSKTVAPQIHKQPNPQSLQGSTSVKETINQPRCQDIVLPNYENPRRNQGLQGFIKYFEKNLEEQFIQVSKKICIEIEKYLFSRNSSEGTFQEDGYKHDVKIVCTQFLLKDSATLKKQIIEEFKIKQKGSLPSIKKILS